MNRQFYELPATVREYAGETSLWPEEAFLFDRWASHLATGALLDLGCGGGRTTPALSRRAASYIGLDYAAPMVEACRSRWPHLTFVHGDASNLDMFGPAEFRTVVFSFNGIDSMSHEKRTRCLSEVFRVLQPGGLFLFSSHNRDDRRKVVAWNLRDLNLKANLSHLRSYWRVRRYQRRTPAYAILSDPLAGFGYLTYYVRKEDQVRELEATGFREVMILAPDLGFVNPRTRDRRSQWFHYTCRKPAEPPAP